ncbi:HsdM family class I SAM-dependent methyltransferase [Sphingopyxis microcysteis]|uniref:HsdM family class I SAM-dependent methyltransferase n=1 Tax=Sphingopyxis microcysteis TaxID=2484145 RepID=UPI001446A659|nr:N-6 DNA methylase [Sphingopyxis microcysteis]
MTALAKIEAGLRSIGYRPESLIHDYSFADVLSDAGEEQCVALAAFTQVPESYRSAAFGVIASEHDADAVSRRRALGAPILLSIGSEDIGVWRVGAEGKPRLSERVPLDQLEALFERNADNWNPRAVHRAKSLGQTQTAYQLDFVDLGLMPAIEHEIEVKLDRLLGEVITQLLTGIDDRQREEAVFRTTFRLLAAKILIDRQHPDAASWTGAPVREVLAGIEEYYRLDHMPRPAVDVLPSAAVEKAWKTLRCAITFRNISSDSLAFVYENTLVTADTRKRFGTHSTPRQVAEYVVSQLDLGRFDPEGISIYEPFAGAGMFLVAALRHLRDQLPDTLGGQKRHAFLVKRIRGAELDAFACEVATLSLILADYPNANGWKIASRDLFEEDALAAEVAGKRIILCNPPWEDFDAEERQLYPEMAAKSVSKPMAVLRTLIEARPDGLGIILPHGFLRQQQYAGLRQLLADQYDSIELTALPQRVFQHASFEAAIVVATGLRDATLQENAPTSLRSIEVAGRDRDEFLASGKTTAERHRIKPVRSGELWIGALDEVWEYLADYPTLGGKAEVNRGLQWISQSAGWSAVPREGFKPGVLKPADSLLQFGLTTTGYVDMREEAAYRLGPLARAWDKPKILANVSPRSRGPWRLDGVTDLTGLVPSQAFFGIWPTASDLPLEVIEALINSPLASAYMLEHATNQHLTNVIMKQLPLPKRNAFGEVVAAVRRYHEALAAAASHALRTSEIDKTLETLLIDVDAQLLKAFDLPPRLERRLLEVFRGHEAERRVAHRFEGWFPQDFTAYIPLHEYVGPLLRENIGAWALDVFTPAPEHEVERLRLYVQ